MVKVPYLSGYGDGEIILDVRYICNDFPVDENFLCAFCHGDPCDVKKEKGALINSFYQKHPDAETCPLCEGKPS